MSTIITDPNDVCFWDSESDACKEFGSESAAAAGELYSSGMIAKANGTFAMVALFQTLTQVFQLTRYRTQDWTAGSGSFYDQWATSGNLPTTNWWQRANQIFMYGKIVLFGPGFILQLLASVGILADINELYWLTGIFNLALMVDLIYLAISAYAYDLANAACRAAGATTDSTCLVQADIKREWMVFFGTQGFVINMLLPQMMPWKYGMYKAQQAAEQPAASLLVDF